MLNFLWNDIIDGLNEPQGYIQVQPSPMDGSMPLACNKWYMTEYELAYDPQISNIPYNEIQFNWILNYMNISQVDLNGKTTGSITGYIGVESKNPQANNALKAATDLGSSVFKGMLGNIGESSLNAHCLDKETGKNDMGMSNALFKTVLSGVKALASSGGGETGPWRQYHYLMP